MKVYYAAEDGRTFDSEDKCLVYEKELKDRKRREEEERKKKEEKRRRNKEEHDKRYEEVKSAYQKYKELADKYLEDYNDDGTFDPHPYLTSLLYDLLG